MADRPPQKSHINFYEIALLLADGQSRNSEERWSRFIDNLSRICDELAVNVHPKEKPRRALWHSPYRSYINQVAK